MKERKMNMDYIIMLILGIAFLAAGFWLIKTPYDKFKSSFPNAPKAGVVKTMGVLILIVGLFIVALFVMSIIPAPAS